MVMITATGLKVDEASGQTGWVGGGGVSTQSSWHCCVVL